MISSKVSLKALSSDDTELSQNKSEAIEHIESVILQITTSIMLGINTNETLIIPIIPTDDLINEE